MDHKFVYGDEVFNALGERGIVLKVTQLIVLVRWSRKTGDVVREHDILLVGLTDYWTNSKNVYEDC
jgi:hypothetical protein